MNWLPKKAKNTQKIEPSFQNGIAPIVNQKLPLSVWLVPISIMLLMTFLIIWSSISRVDIINQATGEVITSDNIKDIQPQEIGQVAEILVKNGQSVTKGDVLIELDSEVIKASFQQTNLEVLGLRKQQLRLATVNRCLHQLGPGDPTEALSLKACKQMFKPDELDPKLVMEAYSGFVAQWNYFINRVELLRNKARVIKVDLQNAQNELLEIEALTPIYESHQNRLQALLENKMGSQRAYDEVKEKYLSQVQSVNRQKRLVKKLAVDLSVANSELSVYKTEFIQQNQTELDDINQQLSIQQRELSKLVEQLSNKTLKSPIDGVVHNLKIGTIGGVVQPAEVLVQVIPKNTVLKVKAKILNRDIGFVHVNQPVRVKLDSFNFIKYGAINGRISRIAKAAILDEELGPVYEALIQLDRDFIDVEKHPVKLIPGMTVTADIFTGERHLIEYVLTPVMRYQDEVMRER